MAVKSNLAKATKAKAKRRKQQKPKGADKPMRPELASTVKDVFRNHRRWINKHPKATLGDLKERLAMALDQCQRIVGDGDPHIANGVYVPEPLASELNEWKNDDEECTFSYRGEELEQLLDDVHELAEELGDDFQVSKIKKLIK